jgi:hypothetical protein
MENEFAKTSELPEPQPQAQPPYRPQGTEIAWEDSIAKWFLKRPGEHALEVGITGSGKTQGLYYLLNGILDCNPSETILWITCGKSAEELKLMQFMRCNFLYPHRRGIDLKLYQKTYPYTMIEFETIPKMFSYIAKDAINILCLAPYFPDPEEYAIVITSFFRTLIVLARDGKIKTPLAIFVDEFQMVAPAHGQALNETHNLGGRWMQRNLDQLRSMGIRIVAAAQSWKRVLQGVRTSFGYIVIRQGAEFTSDIPRLMKRNDKWQGMNREEMIFAFRNRFYSDLLTVPTYGDGYDVGRIDYIDYTQRMRVEDIDIDSLIDNFKSKGKRKREETEEDAVTV